MTVQRWFVVAALIALSAGGIVNAEQLYLRQSQGVGDPPDLDVWRKAEQRGGLKPYPAHPPGTRNPADGLRRYGGSGTSSFGSTELGMTFADWFAKMSRQRAEVDRAATANLKSRFALDCKKSKTAKMSRGKAIAVGPTAILPAGVAS